MPTSSLQQYLNNMTYSVLENTTGTSARVRVSGIQQGFWDAYDLYGSDTLSFEFDYGLMEVVVPVNSSTITTYAGSRCLEFTISGLSAGTSYTFTAVETAVPSGWTGFSGTVMPTREFVTPSTYYALQIIFTTPITYVLEFIQQSISAVAATYQLKANKDIDYVDLTLVSNETYPITWIEVVDMTYDGTYSWGTFTINKLWHDVTYAMTGVSDDETVSGTTTFTTSSPTSWTPTVTSCTQSTIVFNSSYISGFNITTELYSNNTLITSGAGQFTNLLFDTTYQILCKATYPLATGHENDIFVSAYATYSGSSNITTLDFPTVPISATSTPDSVTLTYTAPATTYDGTYTYHIDYNTTTGISAPLTFPITATIGGLVTSTTYLFKFYVVATNDYGTKSKSYDYSYSTGVYDITLTPSATSNTISVVATNCPTSNNYILSFGVDDANYTNISASTSTVNYIFTALYQTNTTHKVYLKLYNNIVSTTDPIATFMSSDITTVAPTVSNLAVSSISQEGATFACQVGAVADDLDVEFVVYKNGVEELTCSKVRVAAGTILATFTTTDLYINTAYTLGCNIYDHGYNVIVKSVAAQDRVSFSTLDYEASHSCTVSYFNGTVSTDSTKSMYAHGTYYTKYEIKDSNNNTIDSKDWQLEPYTFTTDKLNAGTAYTITTTTHFGDTAVGTYNKVETFTATTNALTYQLKSSSTQHTVSIAVEGLPVHEYTLEFYESGATTAFATEIVTSTSTYHRLPTDYTTSSAGIAAQVRVITKYNYTYTLNFTNLSTKSNQITVSFNPTQTTLEFELDSPYYTSDTIYASWTIDTASTQWVANKEALTFHDNVFTCPYAVEPLTTYNYSISYYDTSSSTTPYTTVSGTYTTLNILAAIDYSLSPDLDLTFDFTTTPTISGLLYDYALTDGTTSTTGTGTVGTATTINNLSPNQSYTLTYTIRTSTKTYLTKTITINTSSFSSSLLTITTVSYHYFTVHVADLDNTYSVIYRIYEGSSLIHTSSSMTPATEYTINNLKRNTTYTIYADIYLAGTICSILTKSIKTVAIYNNVSITDIYGTKITGQISNLSSALNYQTVLTIYDSTETTVIQTKTVTITNASSATFEFTNLSLSTDYVLRAVTTEYNYSYDTSIISTYVIPFTTLTLGTFKLYSVSQDGAKIGLINLSAGTVSKVVFLVSGGGSTFAYNVDVPATYTSIDVDITETLIANTAYTVNCQCYSGTTLLGEINDNFTTKQLEFVLQLVNKGTNSFSVRVLNIVNTYPNGIVSFAVSTNSTLVSTKVADILLPSGATTKSTTTVQFEGTDGITANTVYQVVATVKQSSSTTQIDGIKTLTVATYNYGELVSSSSEPNACIFKIKLYQWAGSDEAGWEIATGSTDVYGIDVYYREHATAGTYTKWERSFDCHYLTDIVVDGLIADTSYDFQFNLVNFSGNTLQTITTMVTTKSYAGRIVQNTTLTGAHFIHAKVTNLNVDETLYCYAWYLYPADYESASEYIIKTDPIYTFAEGTSVQEYNFTNLDIETTYTAVAVFYKNTDLNNSVFEISGHISTNEVSKGYLGIATYDTENPPRITVSLMNAEAYDGWIELTLTDGTNTQTGNSNISDGLIPIPVSFDIDLSVRYTLTANVTLNIEKMDGTYEAYQYTLSKIIKNIDFKFEPAWYASDNTRAMLTLITNNVDAGSSYHQVSCTVTGNNSSYSQTKTGRFNSYETNYSLYFTNMPTTDTRFNFAVTVTGGDGNTYTYTYTLRRTDAMLGTFRLMLSSDLGDTYQSSLNLNAYISNLNSDSTYEIRYWVYYNGYSITPNNTEPIATDILEASAGTAVLVDSHKMSLGNWTNYTGGQTYQVIATIYEWDISSRVWIKIGTLSGSQKVGDKPFAYHLGKVTKQYGKVQLGKQTSAYYQTYFSQQLDISYFPNDCTYTIQVRVQMEPAYMNNCNDYLDKITLTGNSQAVMFPLIYGWAWSQYEENDWDCWTRIYINVFQDAECTISAENGAYDSYISFLMNSDGTAQDSLEDIEAWATPNIENNSLKSIDLCNIPKTSYYSWTLRQEDNTYICGDRGTKTTELIDVININLTSWSIGTGRYKLHLYVSCTGYNDQAYDLTIVVGQSTIAVAYWDWTISNGEATAEQTQQAKTALDNKQAITNFSYHVWNDMVSKVGTILDATGNSWPTAGLTMAQTKMSSGNRQIMANKYNQLMSAIRSCGAGRLTTDQYQPTSGTSVLATYFLVIPEFINAVIDFYNN